MVKSSIPAVILAGGKSSRMGEDKSLLPFIDGKTLAQYQYERLLEIFDEVYISTKEEKFSFTKNLILEDAQEFAPTYGILQIINTLKRPFFLIGVDVPLFSKESIKTLLDAYHKDLDGVVGSSQGRFEPLCGIYSPTIKEYILESIESNCHRLGKIIKRANVEVIDFKNSEEFINMNTPDLFYETKKLIEEKYV